MGSPSRCLAADEPGDGVGGLADLLGALVGIATGCVDHAVAEVVLDQADAHGLEGLGHGGDLREDVDAVHVLVHHARDAAHLALDALEPLEVGVLVGGVPVHAAHYTPMGYGPRSRRLPAPHPQRHHLERAQLDDPAAAGRAQRASPLHGALVQVRLDHVRGGEPEPQGRAHPRAVRLIGAHDDVTGTVLGQLDRLDHHGGLVERDERCDGSGATERARRDVEPVALRHRALDGRPRHQREAEPVQPLVGVRVGEAGRAQQGEADQRRRAAVLARGPRDVVPVHRVVGDRDPVAGLADVDPAVGDGLEPRRVPRRVGVGGPVDVPELDLAGGALGVHVERATSEIQFGHVHRPTHANTSWDAARFETVAHRWVHVGEAGYGVAVANDSVYGHDITRSTREDGGTTTLVRLSLLRAPRFPDPDADQGLHRFRFALVPGAPIEGAVAEGYRLNVPPRPLRGAGPVAPLVAFDEPAVVVEAVKLAEDRSGDVVVRAYEAHGSRVRTPLRLGFAAADVVETDLHERPVERARALRTSGGGWVVELRPFQVVTLRVRRG